MTAKKILDKRLEACVEVLAGGKDKKVDVTESLYVLGRLVGVLTASLEDIQFEQWIAALRATRTDHVRQGHHHRTEH